MAVTLSFLDLPTELRLMVYKHLFRSTRTAIHNSYNSKFFRTPCDKQQIQSHTTVLQVHSQLYQEVKSVWLEHAQFEVADCRCWVSLSQKPAEVESMRGIVVPKNVSLTRLRNFVAAPHRFPTTTDILKHLYIAKPFTYINDLEELLQPEIKSINKITFLVSISEPMARRRGKDSRRCKIVIEAEKKLIEIAAVRDEDLKLLEDVIRYSAKMTEALKYLQTFNFELINMHQEQHEGSQEGIDCC